MSRDYIRDLFMLLADGKITEFTRQGNQAIKDIEEDIADMQVQAGFIRRALVRHGMPSEIQHTLSLGTGRQAVSASYHPLDDIQRKAIREIATQLVTQTGEVTVEGVLADIAKKGITLTVAKPSAVVGSMLSKWKEFTKIGEGKYRKT